MQTIISQVHTALSNITGINNYYELFCDETIKKPCITYLEQFNGSVALGDTMEYSNIIISVKVWANDYADIDQYAPQVDTAMRQLGFTVRQSTNEIIVGHQICKQMVYSAPAAIEKFDN